ncbi:hypothetical protein D3C72_2079610 [compost metagenome]
MIKELFERFAYLLQSRSFSFKTRGLCFCLSHFFMLDMASMKISLYSRGLIHMHGDEQPKDARTDLGPVSGRMKIAEFSAQRIHRHIAQHACFRV